MDIVVTRARRIYSDGRHNAWTGICRHESKVYVSFRSGINHVAPRNTVKLIASADCESWSVVAERGEVSPEIDNRDPKVVSFGGRLFVYYPRCRARNPEREITGMVFTSSDGSTFSQPEPVQGLPDRIWVWWMMPREDRLYGTGYARGRCLLASSADGLTWEPLTDLPVEAGNEAAFDFDPDGAMWVLVREDSYGCIPTVCVLKPPYRRVDWKLRLPMRLQGPMIKRLPGGCVIVCRQWDSPRGLRRNTRTEMFWLADGELPRHVCTLPSGGDTSYAQWLDTGPGSAVISYYTSHEHKMAVRPNDPGLAQDHALAEHSTAADIFLADVAWTP